MYEICVNPCNISFPDSKLNYSVRTNQPVDIKFVNET